MEYNPHYYNVPKLDFLDVPELKFLSWTCFVPSNFWAGMIIRRRRNVILPIGMSVEAKQAFFGRLAFWVRASDYFFIVCHCFFFILFFDILWFSFCFLCIPKYKCTGIPTWCSTQRSSAWFYNLKSDRLDIGHWRTGIWCSTRRFYWLHSRNCSIVSKIARKRSKLSNSNAQTCWKHGWFKWEKCTKLCFWPSDKIKLLE